MAVIAVWKCTRDGSMHEDKKVAEAHDKMLELAANLTALIEAEINGIDESHAEEIGLKLQNSARIHRKIPNGKRPPGGSVDNNAVRHAQQRRLQQ